MEKIFVGTKKMTLESIQVGKRIELIKEKKSLKFLGYFGGVVFLSDCITKILLENVGSILFFLDILFHLVVGVFFLALPSMCVKMAAYMVYTERLKAGLPTISTITINDEGVIEENEQSKFVTKWGRISKGYLYKGYIIFAVTNVMIAFKLSDLTQGTQEELIRFVKEKIRIKG